MAAQVDETSIRSSIRTRISRELSSLADSIEVDRFTPSGRVRSAPIYLATVTNETLDKSRTIKDKSIQGLISKAEEQLKRWGEQEARSLVSAAKKDLKEATRANAEFSSQRARHFIQELHGILHATLDRDDRIDWAEMEDHRQFREFQPAPAPQAPPLPSHPPIPKKPFLAYFIPKFSRDWNARCVEIHELHEQEVSAIQNRYMATMGAWKEQHDQAEKAYTAARHAFLAAQKAHNSRVKDFRRRFEEGDPDAIVEYINTVFERSSYPDGTAPDYLVAYDRTANTLVANIYLPDQESITTTRDYKYVSRSNSIQPIKMKKKEHDALYDSVVKQIVLRTMHEVFESAYTPHIARVVVNGWTTYVDKATGNDQTSCIISVSASRDTFEALNLRRVDPSECLKALRALVAGPLSEMAPVKPIMQLDTNDPRLVESRYSLAELNSTTNLAEIPWEEFEHLVGRLFSEMFSGDGAQVHVTRASRDQGVDAIAFDPDPIRGGKFVIQAKRYTRTVGVAAVRELYGTMINEGAVKGILVTTSSYGRDSRQFVKDKPITLIDGPNLVYLLEQHGHKVRIDIDAARSTR